MVVTKSDRTKISEVNLMRGVKSRQVIKAMTNNEAVIPE